ncbi:hypothetical protein KGP17_05515 [Serratia sp. JSRIV001]|uniref:hypothetical protein n=1 Tax=unclassified Serratia (in: enterobacteria) TaxID=2647522 RepID=UPI001CBAF9B5|nr:MULTISPECIES: hypothetical protein [unclassified Serratia (in: enterobacteria)]UAN47002.1 hypothetical protein KGP17_05515 [Serratia sp. JSRIV001]UAN55443.1 hypothetical protein KGP21_17250 [Serratia sp. JSRIV004]UAN57256.1 hypothetical protein KGP21_27275 [Serratia sp. JSRIV004]
MQMSRPELDGRLAALSKLNGNKPGKKDPAVTHKSFKSRRTKRKKGKTRNGR